MAFWGVEVKPGKPFTHTADDSRGRLHISQATLGNGTAAKKSVVQCNVGNKSPVFLCSLFPEKAESSQLNLEFEEADEVVFSVVGPRSVHLTGYFLGISGRHYNLNDESESFGEDIADTETERSTGPSDEDKYEDSFINDDDPAVFPPSSLSGSGEIEEISDRNKPKNGKRSHRRLRKKYQLSESDDDVSVQKQVVANGSCAVTASDGESEDMLPISSLCKSNPDKSKKIETEKKVVRKNVETNPATNLEAEEKTDNTPVETGTGGAKDSGNCFIMSEGRSDAAVKSEPKRSELRDSMLPSVEMGAENSVKPKKKRKVSRKVKHLGGDANDCSNVLKEEKAPKNDSEMDEIVQYLPVPNEENQKTSNHVEKVDLPPDSLPHSTQVGSENDAKPKKRKGKERAEKSLEVDSVGHAIVIDNDKALHDDMRHDSIGQDLPGRVEQNEMQATDVIPENDVDQSVAKNQPEEKQKKKKRKRTEKDRKAMNMEKPPLSIDPKSESVMVTENSSADSQLSQLRILPNGLVIQELETGKPDGKVAALGKKISVHYTGKLKENGQVFDSNLGSTPLKFHLGRKGVLEGLNVGLEGMRVGEKRRLLIPPSMGYGSEGDDSKNIRPDSWLEFDVNLVKVHR